MKNKYLKLSIIALLAGTLLLGTFFFIQSKKSINKEDSDSVNIINMNPPTEHQIKDGQDTKASTLEQDQSSGNSDSSPSDSRQTTMYTSAKSVDSGVLNIRVVIEGVYSGECKLTLSNGSLVVQKSVPVQPQASTSTCQGFTIPTSELSPGTWQYSIDSSLSAGSVTAQTSGEVTIQ